MRMTTHAHPSEPIRISDVDDPSIAVFRAVKERDLIGREGLFIAEGLTVVTVLLTASHIETLALFVEERRAERTPVLEQRGAVPLFVAPQPVMDKVAGFHLHRGILAAGRIPEPSPLVRLLTADPLRLPVLVGLSNHDNVGGLFRNAAAFGSPGVIIDRATADPFYRKAIRVGVGAPLIVPTARINDAARLAGTLHEHGVTPYALSPRASITVGREHLARRAAFFLGTEGGGLPDAVIENCVPLRIAMSGTMDSLNVVVAGAIALHAHANLHPA